MDPRTPPAPDIADGPVVDSDRIDGIYKTLEGLRVELDIDPLEFGPKRLNAKIAESRAMLGRCEQLSLQVSHDLHWYKRRYRTAVADHTLQVQHLLANDPDVRVGMSIKDREAIANMKLRSNQERVNRLSYAVEDLESVMVVIRTKRADLKDTQGRLKDQLKVCQEELTLGSRWGRRGDAPSRTKKGGSVQADSGVDESLDALLDGAIQQMESKAETAVRVRAVEALATSEIVETDNNTDVLTDNSRASGMSSDFGEKSEDPRLVAGIQGNATTSAVDDALDSIPDIGAQMPKMLAEDDLDSLLELTSSTSP